MTRPGPLVLMYHGIADVAPGDDPHNLFVPPAAFESQLRALRDGGFAPVGLDEYLDARSHPARAPARQVLLTFDDGYVSVLETAAPLLAEQGFPALCFISAGLLGHRPHEERDPAYNLMDAHQVSALPQHGIDVGVHGWAHHSMTAATPEALRQDTQDARDRLGRLLGGSPRSFAYPYGDHDAAARAAVRDAGYRVGFATHDGAGPMAVARVDINATDTLRTFSIKLRPWYPGARRALGTVAPVRRLVHRALGSADRSSQEADLTP